MTVAGPRPQGSLGGVLRGDPDALRSLRLFSTEPGADRSRRPTDWVILIVSATFVLLAIWAAEPPGELSQDLADLIADAPGWFVSACQVVYDLMLAWAGLLVVFAVLRRQVAPAATAVGSAALAIATAYVAQRWAASEPLDTGEFLRQFTRSEAPEVFPGIRLAVTAAVLVVMSPAVSRPYRFFGRIVLLLGFLATLGLATATVVGALGGLAVGAAAAAAGHLVAGSPGGRPSRDEIRLVLAELGVTVDELEPASLEPAGVVLLDATDVEGRDLSVKVYGRDAWDGQFIAKFWRYLWYRTSHSALMLSRLHQVEHEALMTLLAERAGAPVPRLLVAGAVTGGDVALVTTAGGIALAEYAETGRELPDGSMREVWSAVLDCHRAGMVHGALDLHSVTIGADGSPVLTDWSAASVPATREAVDAEIAQLVVLSALVVGADRAMELALDAVGADDLTRAVPYVQRAALTTDLRHDVRVHDLDLDDLRDVATRRPGVDQVELVELRRVTVRSVGTVLVVALAAMLLISSLSDIGLDTIVDELSTASWGWVVAALAVAQFARFWSGVATTGATDHPLRLGPTVVLEFAITFVNLVIPSTAARFATKLRYFQRAGMTVAAATAMGAIDSLSGFAVQLLILISALLLGAGGTAYELDVDPDAVQRLVGLVAVVVVVAALVGAATLALVPSVRAKAADLVHQVREAFAVVRSPTKLLRLFGGNAMAEITFASVLGLSLAAYGESAPIMSLLLVNVAVALFAGLMPVPGGVGVTEAALTAGLIAIGVPEATAFAAAITTRLCTFYLPPIWGYLAMRWLRANDYL